MRHNPSISRLCKVLAYFFAFTPLYGLYPPLSLTICRLINSLYYEPKQWVRQRILWALRNALFESHSRGLIRATCAALRASDATFARRWLPVLRDTWAHGLFPLKYYFVSLSGESICNRFRSERKRDLIQPFRWFKLRNNNRRVLPISPIDKGKQQLCIVLLDGKEKPLVNDSLL